MHTAEDLYEVVADERRLPDAPMVSVCMLAYNHEAFIAKALDSVLMQEAPFNVEIIIAEDQSTDSTRAVLLEYQQKHPEKFRLLLAKQNVYSQGINPGPLVISASRGSYLAFLEGDDCWTDPEKLQVQVSHLEAHPDCALCHHDVQIHYQDGRCPDHCGYEKPAGLPHSQTSGMPPPPLRGSSVDLAQRNYIYTGSVLMRNWIKEAGYPDAYRSGPVGDWPLFLLTTLRGATAYLNSTMSLFRIHTESTFTSKPAEWREPRVLPLRKVLAYDPQFPLEARHVLISDYMAALIRLEESQWDACAAEIEAVCQTLPNDMGIGLQKLGQDYLRTRKDYLSAQTALRAVRDSRTFKIRERVGKLMRVLRWN